MTVCAVLGCDSHSKIKTNYTFHALPQCPLTRTRWLLALGRAPGTVGRCPQVCSRHFADAMFVERGRTKALVRNAVPTLFLPPETEQQSSTASDEPEGSFYLKKSKLAEKNRPKKMKIPEIKRPKIKRPVKGASDDVLACRVCLAVDVPLYDTGFEGTFAELTGVPLSAAAGFPRRLCGLCRAQLSKCAAFRGRCRRSHSLLQTLLERGPLKVNDVKSIDRHLHRLTNNLTLREMYNIQYPAIEIPPLIKSEEETSTKVSELSQFSEVEYLEDNDTKDVDMDFSEEEMEIRQTETVKLEAEISNEHLELTDCMESEPKSATKDVGTDSSEEKAEIRKKGKTLKVQDEISIKYLETEDCFDTELKDDTDEIDSDTDSSEGEIQDKRKKLKLDDEMSDNYLETENNDVDTDSSEEKVETLVRKKNLKLDDEVSDRYSESDLKDDTNKVDTDFSEDEIPEKRKKLKLNEEMSDRYSETDLKDDINKVDTDSSEEMVKIRKKRKATIAEDDISTNTSDLITKLRNTKFHFSCRRRKIGDEYYPDFNYEALEKAFNVTIKFLSSEEQRQEIEDIKNANKALFSCKMCGKGYNYEDTFSNHLLVHDPSSGPYECEICRRRFQLNRCLLTHRDTHRLAFACNACSFVSRDRTKAKTHYFLHKGKQFKCLHCDQVYKRKSSCSNHMRIQHPGKNMACDECGETFLSVFGVQRHKLLTHRPNENSKTEFKCSVCEVAFLSSAALDKHTMVAGDMSHAALWPCAACGDSCGSHAAQLAHVAERHPTDQLRCEECDSTFTNAASFDLHVKRKHLGVRNTSGSSRQRLARPSRPAVCEVCGLVLKNAVSLRYHLNTHLPAHLAVKPFACPKCPKSFATKRIREQHLPTHLTVRPFACPKCPKTFATKHIIEAHMFTHTGEKPFQCEHCPQAFTLRANLERHRKTVHLNLREFACELCQKTMSSRRSVNLHIQTVHNKMPWPRRERKARKPAPKES